MKVCAAGERLVRVGKKLDGDSANGESIGMMIFSRTGAEVFVQKVQQLESGPDGLARWYLSALDELASAELVGVSSIQGHGWCEVDEFSDFAHAGKAVKSWQGLQSKRPDAGTNHTARTRCKMA